MSGFEAFLKQNKKQDETMKFAASMSFTDKNGKPLEWEIRPLKSKEAAAIRKLTNKIGKGGRVDVDNETFNRMAAAKATVFPDLNDKELQDSYGVMCAEDLIVEMLDKDGEFQEYVKNVMAVSGYNITDTELVKEAKN
ncbi:MAG: hypothetical protein HFI77_10715 [Lachnospiraceae bacterium]|nr:hypothetical protein [Lachnospiraceae bacterium]